MAAPAPIHHHHRRGMARRINVVDHDGIGARPRREESEHLLQRAAVHNGRAGIKAPGESWSEAMASSGRALMPWPRGALRTIRPLPSMESVAQIPVGLGDRGRS